MAVQGVNFGNEQQKQSSGILFPTLGAAAGAGIAGFTKFGKKPIALEGLAADKFQKSAEGANLEGADKTAYDTVLAHLNKQTAETTPAASTPEAPKAPTAPVEPSDLEKADKDFRAKQTVYVQKDAELKLEQKLNEKIQKAYKDIHSYSAPQEVKIDPTSKEATDLKNRKEYLEQAITEDEAKLKDENLDEATKATIKARKEKNEAEKVELENKTADTATMKQNYAKSLAKPMEEDVTKADKAVKAAKESLEKAKKESIEQDTKVETAQKAFDEAKKANKPAEEITKLETELKSAKEEADKIGKKITELKNDASLKQRESDFVKSLKEALETPDEATRNASLEKLLSGQKELVDAEKGTKVLASKTAYEKAEASYKNVYETKTNAGKIADFKAEFKKEMGTMTSAVTGETVKVEPPKVEAPKVEISEAVKTAFESIKSKLKPVELSGGKIAAGAGIGLAVGLLIKLMADGSSKSES